MDIVCLVRYDIFRLSSSRAELVWSHIAWALVSYPPLTFVMVLFYTLLVEKGLIVFEPTVEPNPYCKIIHHPYVGGPGL